MKKLLKSHPTNNPFGNIQDFHQLTKAKIENMPVGVSEDQENPFPADTSPKEYPRFQEVRLRLSESELREGMRNRRSDRDLTGKFSMETVEKVASCLIVERKNRYRIYPSAGALYPCHLYLIGQSIEGLGSGLFYIDVFNMKLVDLFRDKESIELALNSIFQSLEFNAPAYFVITAQVMRTAEKYGVRGYRFAHLEAGAIAWQINVLLEEIQHKTLWLGGFDDQELAKSLGINMEQEGEYPLIVMAATKPCNRSE